MNELQSMIGELYSRRGYTSDLFTLVLGLCEEAGEVAKATNTYHNPKYKLSDHSISNTVEHELCDVMVYLYCIANSLGIPLDESLYRKLDCALSDH